MPLSLTSPHPPPSLFFFLFFVDSQGSILVMFFKFIYCFVYVLWVHLLFYLYSSSSFIVLFIFFEFIYCFIYVLLVHLLLHLYALSCLLLSFVDLNIFIALFTFTTYLCILCCDYPFPVCFSMAILSGFGGMRKTSMRP